MILQSLHQLYHRLSEDPAYEIAPRGFSPQKISFCVVIQPDGTLFDIEDVREGGRTRLMTVPGEAKPSGSGINPCFLWDNQTYLLGRQPEDKKDGFGKDRFEAFRERHLQAEAEIDLAEFGSVCRFLERWTPEELENWPILAELGTGFGVVRIQGQLRCVHELPGVKDWWIQRLETKERGASGQCLISGEMKPIARLHPKIKGVAGAQSAGAAIVSFNDSAYESYGKEQSFNSPVSEEVAFRYGTALNALLGGPLSKKHRTRIGDTTVVFWTEKPTLLEDCLADILGDGSNAPDKVQDETQQDRIRRVLRAIRAGRIQTPSEDEDPGTPFFILGLAPNAARLSVRFFFRSTLEDLMRQLHDHQLALEMIREFETAKGKRFPDPEFPAIWQILRETARASDEVSPLLGGALARSIIEGTDYPGSLLAAILRRIQADRTINYLRAATVKAVLVRNHKLAIPIMLDPENTDSAYLLGRLFAVLEKTQDDALGLLNAGIRDRYYSAASATPASVFPRLLKTYQHHLGKLSPGAKINREKLVQEIFAPVVTFPRQLTLQQQGLFAIGYYHQRRDLFSKKTESHETETNQTAA